ncbi:hypothetical protein [Magnetospirillum molischianum]|uniref:Uncharacterized protein n=1 Tax=Magnetospirillum molischianum DSM 120 TaxID=1150626 RepID=H8FNY6_MAGML|nr:hypothetical protein [Magnetospirillum molischianum]CCG40074.1 conserved hypothetical protein [Magnetospirillum molischianum DSM 120]
MTDRTPCSPQSSSCRDVGTTMISHFVTRLEVEAAKVGGSLSAAEIRALAQHFLTAEQDCFGTYYQRAWDDCSHLREALQFEHTRKRPFDRILMRRFSYLYPPRLFDEGRDGVLSRRMIPGFVLAIDKMIGPTLRERGERICTDILVRHSSADGRCDWNAVYTDSETIALIDYILGTVAQTFTDFERRRTWMIDLIDSHLAPADPAAPDAHWTLGQGGFIVLMRAMFSDFARRLQADPAAARAFWGSAAFTTIAQFLFHLDEG